MARLVVRGPAGETAFPLRGSAVSIGRADTADLQLVDQGISRMHCRFEPDDGGWTVVDAGSSNGTVVNGSRVQRRALAHGDEIALGKFTVRYESPAEGARDEPAEAEGEARGRFDRELDLGRAAELLTVLGETRTEGDAVLVDAGVEAHRDGTMVARAEDGKAAKDLLERARQLVVRAELCVGCGVCVPRCPAGALSIEDMRVVLDGGECVHCGSCFGPCAVVDFPPVVVGTAPH